MQATRSVPKRAFSTRGRESLSTLAASRGGGGGPVSFERPLGPGVEPAAMPASGGAPSAERVPLAVQLQILSTEPYSLISPHALAWSESFSRVWMSSRRSRGRSSRSRSSPRSQVLEEIRPRSTQGHTTPTSRRSHCRPLPEGSTNDCRPTGRRGAVDGAASQASSELLDSCKGRMAQIFDWRRSPVDARNAQPERRPDG